MCDVPLSVAATAAGSICRQVELYISVYARGVKMGQALCIRWPLTEIDRQIQTAAAATTITTMETMQKDRATRAAALYLCHSAALACCCEAGPLHISLTTLPSR